jgi:CRISPR system Cascade subunit CasE
MNWLARLDIDAQTASAHRIFDNYAWHKRIWEDCFERAPEAKRDFLTRIDHLEKMFRVWVLANRKPVQAPWCLSERFSVKEVPHSFLSHRFYAFDLRANPTKCVDQQDSNGNIVLRRNGTRTKGKRIPIVKPDELRAWLLRKAQVRRYDEKAKVGIPGGFRIVEKRPLEISPMVENHFRTKEESAYHGGVQFRGILEVTDRERFIETYQSGIGSAKGFGFGLLLLSPISLNKENPNV